MTRAIHTSVVVVDQVRDDQAGKWDAFVSASAGGSVYHRFGWKRVFERAYGNECIYLMARENGAVAGILPLVSKKSRLFGKFLSSLPYFDHVGICGETDEAREELLRRAQQLAKARGADYLELRHDREYQLRLQTRQSKVSLVLELPAEAEALWSGLKAKVRNQARKAEREGLSACIGGEELLDEFFGVYITNMRDLGSPSHSGKFFKAVCEAFPEEVRIFSVRLGQAPVAAGFTLASKDTLTIPWASSLREHNTKCPNMLLYWSVLKYACEAGFSRFSFGRSTLDEGTYRFKRQWGAQPKPLYWQYWVPNGGEAPELNMDNSKYSLPIKMWKRMPVVATRVLGPRLIRNLS